MRYAFISDVHSNLEALSAVLKKIDGSAIDEIVCLGDIVGYNANPNECIEIIKTRDIKCIMGNHDSRAAGLKEPDDFNYLARDAILWTRKQLKEEYLTFLKTLPRKLYIENNKIVVVHGSVNSTDDYILSLSDVADNFRLMGEESGVNTCFFGHTHVRIGYKEINANIYPFYENKIMIEDGVRYLINPGSVGQPRDGEPMASFLIYDTNVKTIEFYRVEYDREKTCEKIVRAGLHIELAERLTVGW